MPKMSPRRQFQPRVGVEGLSISQRTTTVSDTVIDHGVVKEMATSGKPALPLVSSTSSIQVNSTTISL
jgi:hypothetical protein